MSSHRHHHKHHRRRGPIASFFARLTGKKGQDYHHRSNFPGINLPKDYDPEAYRAQSRISRHGEDNPDADEDQASDAAMNPQPKTTPSFDSSEIRHSPSKKRTLFKSFERYRKERELRKEEKVKEKIRRQHRKRAQKEFQQMNKGRGFFKKVFSSGDPWEEPGNENKVPLLSQRNPAYRNMTILVNSTMIFISTYIIVYLFYWLTSMLVASFYGLDSTLYFYDLKFNDHSPLWNRLNILMVTGISPFLCLMIGIIMIQYVIKIERFTGTQKLFILWTTFHLFCHFFGALPSGIVTDEGFGYVAAWLYMNTAIKFLFSLLSLGALTMIGYYSAKTILETSDSLHRIKGDHRLSFMLYQTALPWFIGTLVLLLLRIPENFNYPYETFILLSVVFLVIPPFFNEKVKPELNLLKIKKRRYVSLGYLAMMVALVAFLRIMLGIGLHFLIEIHISISPAVS